jgi:hypothetical protein
LPDYVAGSGGLVRELPIEVPSGTDVVSVSLLATTNAKLVGVFVNGEQALVFTGAERGHPIYEVQLPIPRGLTAELRYELTEPTTPGAPRVPIQPLRDTVVPVVSVPDCPG